MLINNPSTKRPEDIELQLKIQQEREFLIAKAITEGRGNELFKINDLSDEHFKQIIETKIKFNLNPKTPR